MEGFLLKLPPGILLALMWYAYLMHGTILFSWFSTLSLLMLTLLYLFYALPGYAQGPVSFLDDALARLFHYMNPPPPGSQGHRPHYDVSSPPARVCAGVVRPARSYASMHTRSHHNVPLTRLTLSRRHLSQ